MKSIRRVAVAGMHTSYCNLAVYLFRFHQLNPGSTLALQNDTQGRMMRLFVCPAMGIEFLKEGKLQPILGYDAGFSKTTLYDGKFKLITGRTGSGENFPIALSISPAKDTNNTCWDILWLEKAGLPLEFVKIAMD